MAVGARAAVRILVHVDAELTPEAYHTASRVAMEEAEERTDFIAGAYGIEHAKPYIEQAIKEGWSSGKLKQALTESRWYSPKRSERIARTEVSMVDSKASHRVATATGANTKHWEVSEDPNVCEICQANADQGEIPVDEPFQSGDDISPAHPGGCRCVVVYSWPEEE